MTGWMAGSVMLFGWLPPSKQLRACLSPSALPPPPSLYTPSPARPPLLPAHAQPAPLEAPSGPMPPGHGQQPSAHLRLGLLAGRLAVAASLPPSLRGPMDEWMPSIPTLLSQAHAAAILVQTLLLLLQWSSSSCCRLPLCASCCLLLWRALHHEAGGGRLLLLRQLAGSRGGRGGGEGRGRVLSLLAERQGRPRLGPQVRRVLDDPGVRGDGGQRDARVGILLQQTRDQVLRALRDVLIPPATTTNTAWGARGQGQRQPRALGGSEL